MIDVSQYRLVPEHTKLDDEAVEDVLQEYNVEKTNLLKIKLRDPAFPEGAGPSDVIKIVRDSRTIDKAVVYRLATGRIDKHDARFFMSTFPKNGSLNTTSTRLARPSNVA